MGKIIFTAKHCRNISKAKKGTHMLPRETRFCLCGCGKSKIVKTKDSWRYFLGHNLSTNHPTRGRTYEDIYGSERAKEYHNLRKILLLNQISKLKDRSYENIHGKKKAKKLKINRKISSLKCWSDPKYISKVEKHQMIGYIAGYFKSYKNNCEIRFQSSYELKAYIKLEHDYTVTRYGRCYFSIPYIYKGEARIYVPDILVEYNDKRKVLIEVKPSKKLNTIINILKFNAGEQYCRENSMKYLIWTENELDE